MKRLVKGLGLIVLLMSLVSVGFAENITQTLPGAGTVPAGTQNASDMSLKYLGQLFGSAGGIINSPLHAELLQELFGIFNKAILALALAWTAYTIITIIFNAAMEGGFVTTQRKQSVFIFARLALGFALLLPLNSGYNTLQILGMRAMLEGVNLANEVWDQVLVYIVHQGIFHDFSDSSKTVSTAKAATTSAWATDSDIKRVQQNKKWIYQLNNKPTGIQGIIYDEVCSAYFARKNPTSSASMGPQFKGQYAQFPSDNNDNGDCGKFYFSTRTGRSTIQQNFIEAMWPVVQNFVNASLQKSNALVCGTDEKAEGCKSLAVQISSALTNYASAWVLNNQMNSTNTSDLTKDTSWEQMAADQGWWGAGRFYWLLSQANWNNLNSNTTPSTSVPWPKIETPKTKTNGLVNTATLPANIDWLTGNAGQGNTIPSILFSNFNNLDQYVHTQTTAADSAESSTPTGGTAGYDQAGLCSSDDQDLRLINDAFPPTGVTDGSPGYKGGDYYYYIVRNSTELLNGAFFDANSLGKCGGAYFYPIYSFGNMRIDNPIDNDGESDQNIHMGNQRLCPKLGAKSPITNLSDIGYCSSTGSYYGTVKGIGTDAISGTFYDAKYINGIAPVMTALGTVTAAFRNLQATGSEGLTDPLYFLTSLGGQMLAAAGKLWVDGADNINTMAAWAGVLNAVQPGSTILQAAMSWWEPMIIAIGGGLFVAGFMLTFYAPIYPFILFLMGALNWLMVCVEFMVALPLAALGVTHPEGHDFLGKAEVALMLTLSACLRPVLMVLGYVAGIIMSYIGFSAVNYMFSNILLDIFGGSTTPAGNAGGDTSYGSTPALFDSMVGVVTGDWTGATTQNQSQNYFSGNSTTDMMIIPLLMVFYGYIVVEVVHFSFTMIHQLPDQVMRWIGGPVAQDRTQGIADKIKQGMSSAAKQGADTVGRGTVDGGKAIGGETGGGIGMGISVTESAAKTAMG